MSIHQYSPSDQHEALVRHSETTHKEGEGREEEENARTKKMVHTIVPSGEVRVISRFPRAECWAVKTTSTVSTIR
jgi:hypothetical protein